MPRKPAHQSSNEVSFATSQRATAVERRTKWATRLSRKAILLNSFDEARHINSNSDGPPLFNYRRPVYEGEVICGEFIFYRDIGKLGMSLEKLAEGRDLKTLLPS